MASDGFERFAVSLTNGQAVSARHYPAAEASAPAIVLGHGAGAPQASPFIVTMAEGLRGRGIHVFTFNFAYMERGRKVPDGNDLLEDCFLAVVHDTRNRLPPGTGGVFVGGKSMGGRIATQIVAKSKRAPELFKGVVALGYPLHPPGRPAILRTAHLPQIRTPMLVVQGSRDAFGTPPELRDAFAPIQAPWRLFVVPDGDHSFKLPAKSSSDQGRVLTQVLDEMVSWMGRVRDGYRL